MGQRKRYWSCTNFANWIRGTEKPHAETMKGWDQWHNKAKSYNSFRYWVAEELLDKIQNAIHWPTDKIYDVKYYINNRWVTKTHTLTSNLERGKWHEFDTRILHSLFDELVNFVEIEQAWHHLWCLSKEERKKYCPPWYAQGWFRWRVWRSPEAGLDHLKWASELTNESWCEDNDPKKYEPSSQAIAAKEVIELYNWWKNVYPNRPDPYLISGWNDLCRRKEKYVEDESNDYHEEVSTALDSLDKIEEAYHQENEEMLIRLIRIRRTLWT